MSKKSEKNKKSNQEQLLTIFHLLLIDSQCIAKLLMTKSKKEQLRAIAHEQKV